MRGVSGCRIILDDNRERDLRLWRPRVLVDGGCDEGVNQRVAGEMGQRKEEEKRMPWG